jgi:ankyrin repeat protein
MDLHSVVGRLFHYTSFLRTVASLLALVALTWSTPAFCDEIHDAAYKGDLPKVTALTKATPSLVFSTDDISPTGFPTGRTPLHSAASSGRLDIVEFLLANRAEVNAKDKEGRTPLHSAADAGPIGSGDLKGVAELLLANNAEVDPKDSFGCTPLLLAAWSGDNDLLELLLAKGADVNAKDDRGRSPLHAALVNGHKNLVEILLANKADVNSRDNSGETPLHMAAAQGNQDVNNVRGWLQAMGVDANDKWAEVMLRIGADVNAKDIHGKALGDATIAESLAAEGLNADDTKGNTMVELLLAKGADVNAKDNRGETPLDAALHNRHEDVAELLRRHGGREGSHPSDDIRR